MKHRAETLERPPSARKSVPAGRHARVLAAAPEKEAGPPPTGKWRSRSYLRMFAFLALAGAAAAAGFSGRLFAESRTDDRMQYFVVAAVAVAGLWALLTATAPQVVTLQGSVLTVKSRRGTDRFDLADGMQEVELSGDPRSSKWSLVLHRGDCSTLHLTRRDVDARALDPLVRQFREVADRRRAEHWARMGLQGLVPGTPDR